MPVIQERNLAGHLLKGKRILKHLFGCISLLTGRRGLTFRAFLCHRTVLIIFEQQRTGLLKVVLFPGLADVFQSVVSRIQVLKDRSDLLRPSPAGLLNRGNLFPVRLGKSENRHKKEKYQCQFVYEVNFIR